MGQTICSYSYSGGNGSGGGSSGGRTTTTTRTYSCEFHEWPVLYDMFEHDPMGLYIIHGVGILFLSFIWFLSCLIRYNDYTRSFIVANLIPLTIYILASLATVMTGRFSGANDFYYQPFYAPDFLIRTIASSTFAMTLPVTLVGFQILNLQTARKRKESSGCWFFIVVPILLGVIYTVVWFFPQLRLYSIDAYVSRGVIFVLGIVNLVSLFSLCCCSAPRPNQASVPSVANARSRLGWSILFAIFAMFPINLMLSIEQFYNVISGSYNMMNMIFHVIQVAECMQPIFFAVSVLLFLPAYRSVFCCSQGYENNKVGEMQVVIQMRAEDLAANFQQMQKLSVPAGTQDSSPYLNQKVAPPSPDFGAVLTNPPNVTSYSVPPPPPQRISIPQPTPAPISYQAPAPQQCTCPQGAMQSHPVYVPQATMLPVEQYQYVQQHPMMVHQQQQPVMAHQLMSSPMIQQGGLVRFASQPNLATMHTLQPAMSVPQLNMLPQSPFYIHN